MLGFSAILVPDGPTDRELASEDEAEFQAVFRNMDDEGDVCRRCFLSLRILRWTPL